mmetsp:Transcript_35883/g.107182  ORF Transcript_35883/g.107182 Transcript_35883/m.107182 type:complete len:231 (+) Transcript_35883:837-1529(+)
MPCSFAFALQRIIQSLRLSRLKRRRERYFFLRASITACRANLWTFLWRPLKFLERFSHMSFLRKRAYMPRFVLPPFFTTIRAPRPVVLAAAFPRAAARCACTGCWPRARTPSWVLPAPLLAAAMRRLLPTALAAAANAPVTAASCGQAVLSASPRRFWGTGWPGWPSGAPLAECWGLVSLPTTVKAEAVPPAPVRAAAAASVAAAMDPAGLRSRGRAGRMAGRGRPSPNA